MTSTEGSSSGGAKGVSIVHDAGRHYSTCGYCKSGRSSSISHGLWAETLTVDDYQELLDRGWRRSGCYNYKPEMETTCCPAYTIRLRAKDFIPSKEQRRVSRRMQRYLDGIWDGKTEEPIDKSNDLQSCAGIDESSSLPEESLATKTKQKAKEEEIIDYLSEQLDLAIQLLLKRGDVPLNILFPKGFVKKVSQTKKKWLIEGEEDLLFTSNLSYQIAALLRRAKSDRNEDIVPGSQKQSSDVNGSLSDLSPKNIAEELADALQRLVRIPALSVRACNGHINFYSAAKEVWSDKEAQSVAPSNKLSVKHESKGCDVVSEKSHKKKRELEIHLKRSCFDPEEFALYKKYQIQVHNDESEEVTESSYSSFLIDTPLIFVPPTSDSIPPCGFGSFHQQYRIDGKLIAVGVIDILPKCVSSKYLFWDPDLAFLSLGKFSALQEIQWVKQNQRQCPSLEYYYLGYYIHSCSKMRYKAAYWPSELLCPIRYEWVPFDIAKPLLDRKKYVKLSDYANAQKILESLLTEEPRETLDMLSDDLDDGNSTYALIDRDAKVFDSDSEVSEGELYHEINDLASVPTDVGNILLGLAGARVRYKDFQADLDPDFRDHFEIRLLRYLKLVGLRLSERMVCSVI